MNFNFHLFYIILFIRMKKPRSAAYGRNPNVKMVNPSDVESSQLSRWINGESDYASDI